MSLQPKPWIAWCAVLAVSICGETSAQCSADWKKTDGYPGIPFLGSAFAVTSWDPDGNGPLEPRLVAAGAFHFIADRVADGVAAFHPEVGQWEDLGGGVQPGFPNVLGTFQDDLIAAGGFTDAGGVTVNNIARWDGTSWSALGAGITGTPIAMTVFNGELIVAGIFATAGGVTVNNIARWNGVSWRPLGNPAGVNGSVFALTVYKGELVAVGQFIMAGGVPAPRIARWNGSQWQSLGTGMNNGTFGVAVLGDDLYAGGNATLAGGVTQGNGVARWDGTTWHAVPGLAFFGVDDLAVYQGDLIVGGIFQVFASDGQARHIVRFDTDTQTWHTMQGGFNQGGAASSLAVYGDELIAAGGFSMAGNTTLQGVARWVGAEQTWKKIAPGFNVSPTNFTTYRGDLVAGGSFGSAGDVEATGVARWDGQAWHPMGSGIKDGVIVGSIDCLQVHDDQLIVGGHFGNAGGVSVDNLAAWDGDTETWSDLGGGVFGGSIPRVQALAGFNGDLIAGGDFDFAGGVPAFNVARWDGAQWHAMGAGTGVIESMAEFQGSLYVSVSTGLQGMQRWDGSSWHAVPNGANNFSMTVWDGKLISGVSDPMAYDGNSWTVLPGWSFEEGSGFLTYVVFEGDLIVGGGFQDAAGIPEADFNVRFDGASWHAMDTATGTLGGSMTAGWVHHGELISNGGVFHADGSFSNWRRLGWAWESQGSGLAGGTGVPVLFGTGTLAAGCSGQLSLTSARPQSPALLFVALSSAPTPFKGGILAAFPFVLTVPLVTNASGALVLDATWPSGMPGGTSIFLQFAIQDPAAPQGISLSNALKGVTP
jgi:trimeric autotransporter adhesin